MNRDRQVEMGVVQSVERGGMIAHVKLPGRNNTIRVPFTNPVGKGDILPVAIVHRDRQRRVGLAPKRQFRKYEGSAIIDMWYTKAHDLQRRSATLTESAYPILTAGFTEWREGYCFNPRITSTDVYAFWSSDWSDDLRVIKRSLSGTDWTVSENLIPSGESITETSALYITSDAIYALIWTEWYKDLLIKLNTSLEVQWTAVFEDYESEYYNAYEMAIIGTRVFLIVNHTSGEWTVDGGNFADEDWRLLEIDPATGATLTDASLVFGPAISFYPEPWFHQSLAYMYMTSPYSSSGWFQNGDPYRLLVTPDGNSIIPMHVYGSQISKFAVPTVGATSLDRTILDANSDSTADTYRFITPIGITTDKVLQVYDRRDKGTLKHGYGNLPSLCNAFFTNYHDDYWPDHTEEENDTYLDDAYENEAGAPYAEGHNSNNYHSVTNEEGYKSIALADGTEHWKFESNGTTHEDAEEFLDHYITTQGAAFEGVKVEVTVPAHSSPTTTDINEILGIDPTLQIVYVSGGHVITKIGEGDTYGGYYNYFHPPAENTSDDAIKYTYYAVARSYSTACDTYRRFKFCPFLSAIHNTRNVIVFGAGGHFHNDYSYANYVGFLYVSKGADYTSFDPDMFCPDDNTWPVLSVQTTKYKYNNAQYSGTPTYEQWTGAEAHQPEVDSSYWCQWVWSYTLDFSSIDTRKYMIAYDMTTKAKLWERETGVNYSGETTGIHATPPTIHGDRIYYAEVDFDLNQSTIYEVDILTGETISSKVVAMLLTVNNDYIESHLAINQNGKMLATDSTDNKLWEL